MTRNKLPFKFIHITHVKFFNPNAQQVHNIMLSDSSNEMV